MTVNGQTATSASIFTFIEPQPTITAIHPTYAGFDDTLTVSGIHFCPAAADNTVQLNGIATSVVSASDTLLKVIVPKNKNCSGKVTVHSCNKSAVSDSSFVYQTRVTSVITFAGQQYPGAADGMGVNAQFWAPSDIELDKAGNLFVAETWNCKIRKITPAGEVTTVAGSGTMGFVDGPALTAQFHSPIGITLDTVGNIYVTEYDNASVRKIDHLSGEVSTFFKPNPSGFIAYPRDVVVDATDAYVSGDRHLYKINLQTGVQSVLYGNGGWGPINIDYSQQIFTSPGGMIMDKDNLTMIDNGYSGGRILSLSKITGQYLGGTTNAFAGSWSLVMDKQGNTYVTDTYNCCIYRVNPSGGISPLVGGGSRAYVDGSPKDARFNNPTGIAVDASGNLLVADNGNNCIRKVIME